MEQHPNPPENLPVVTEPVESEPEEGVHFREPEPGDTLPEPMGHGVANTGDSLETCSLTTKTHMKQEKAVASQAAFMTASQLAAWLNTTKYSIYQLVRQDQLPCYRYSGKLYFRIEDVEQFLKERRAKYGNPKN